MSASNKLKVRRSQCIIKSWWFLLNCHNARGGHASVTVYPAFHHEALSRGRRGWGVASRSTVHMTWQTSWIIHGRRVTKVVWETRVGLASPSYHSYLFPQIPRRRKKEMERSQQCKHVTCHMYCVTAAWRTDKTWPMTWACSRGQKIKTASFWINVLIVRGATQKILTCDSHQAKYFIVRGFTLILSTIKGGQIHFHRSNASGLWHSEYF